MKCIVDGVPFNTADIIYRDQGYGSSPGVPSLTYVLSVDDDELLRVFDISFREFVTQCKLDDQKSPNSDIPELKELKYPSLFEMLAMHRKLLAGLLKEYLYFQLLDALFSKNRRTTWRFAINEINEVLDADGRYQLSGSGYRIDL